MAENQAAAFDKLFELGLLFVGEIHSFPAGNPENWSIVQFLGLGREVDDLPVEILFHLLADPAGDVGHLARTLIPARRGGGCGFVAGGGGVIELVHHHRRAAANQKHQTKAGVGNLLGIVAPLLLAPGSIFLLGADEIVSADLIPVLVAKIFIAAGDADAL